MIEGMFTNTCRIERWSPRTPGPDFVIRPDWSTVAERVPCVIQERTGVTSTTVAGAQVTFNAVAFFRRGVLLTPHSEERSVGDRITLDDGAMYFVRAVLRQNGGISPFVKVLLEST